jgi:leucyl aminopeptidase
MTDKNALIQPDKGQDAISIHLVDKDGLEEFIKGRSAPQRAALEAQKFEGDGYSHAIFPDGDGWAVVAGVTDTADLSSWCMAKLAEVLPEGTYRREGGEPGAAMFGWVTGQYKYNRYRSETKDVGPRVLLTGEAKKIAAITAEAEATMLVRDLVNTPAEDMGPDKLEAEAELIAKACNAQIRVTKGDTLEQDYPMVHAVGRAATRNHAPRMIELEWGNEKSPRIAIVGKGVCFDSGGLDIKTHSGMLLMKKDMGGAAHALALAKLVMQQGLDVRLHLLVPAVENAVAANAMRPGDVLRSRSGKTVEVTNTDAEGRLILGDALTRAGENDPELIVDFATLTGAARSALGPDLPALFASKAETARAILDHGKACDDPCWELPLHQGYHEYLKSDIADFMNSHANPFAGASVAALFLEKFVDGEMDWVHFDTYAWRPNAKPGRTKGGDALGLRATWRMLEQRYG